MQASVRATEKLWGALVDKIRILLANYPLMVPDAIRRLVAEQEDMELVGDCRGPMNILQETGRTKADAVILAQEGTNEPGLCGQLLAVYPDLTILRVSADMSAASIQKLCSRRVAVPSTECADLIETLRAAVRNLCEEERS
jgi:hypothetical protein